MKEETKLVHKFKEHGYKMTPQRRAILEIIASSSSHPTAEQIYEVVQERMPDTSLATVYNTLHELVAIEGAFELDLGRGVRRYEISPVEHGHMVCLGCDRIYDIEGDFERLRSLFRIPAGARPVRYAVTIYGYCVHCEIGEH
jgi:Fe2+ or Zn2+ uptake regulation protein